MTAVPEIPDRVRSNTAGQASSATPSPVPRTSYQPLAPVVMAAAAGILVDRYHPLPWSAWWIAALVSLLIWWGRWRRQAGLPAAAALLVAIAALAGAWHHASWSLFPDDDLGRFADSASKPVCIEAVASTGARDIPPPPPDPFRVLASGRRTRLLLDVTRIRHGAAWRSASGRVELMVEGATAEIRSGDRLRVMALLTAPAGAANPGEFDYARYLRADRRRAVLHAQHAEGVEVIARRDAWSLSAAVDAVRTYSHRLFMRYLQPRGAGLAEAVFLGAREQLEPEQTAAFFETGTIHLLVVSGLNVGMLAGAVWFVVRRVRMPHIATLVTVAAITFFYMLLTEAEPPVTRATVLVLGMCLAVAMGRPAMSLNTLAAAALVVLAMNPADLFNTGAQLSFLCVAVMAWATPRWIAQRDERQRKLDALVRQSQGALTAAVRTAARAMWNMTLLGTIIWLAVLPLVMARFHIITPVGPILTALLWLPVEVAMVSGFVLLLIGWFPPLAGICGGLCGGALVAMQWLVDLGRRMPHSCVWVPGPADWWLVGFYAALGVLLVMPRWCPPRRWCLALLAGWTAAGFLAGRYDRRRDDVDCRILSVQHGCAVVVQLPSGQTLLYDAGQFGSHTSACRAISGTLWSEGITHLDAVVVSHADMDHYNALPELLQRFSVGAIYVSPVMFRDRSEAMLALGRAIEDSRTPLRILRAGDRFDGGRGCSIRVLHPPPGGLAGKDNFNSVVLSIEHAGRRILLTGDLEGLGMDSLLRSEPIPHDVVLSPHHGSKRSKPGLILGWAKPKWAVISAGRTRHFEELESTYTSLGCGVRHTHVSGAIRVRLSQMGVAVQAYRNPSQAGYCGWAGPWSDDPTAP